MSDKAYGHRWWYPDDHERAAEQEPDSQPIGNTDDNKRGRGLGPDGRPAPDDTPLSGAPEGKKPTIDDADGHQIGGR